MRAIHRALFWLLAFGWFTLSPGLSRADSVAGVSEFSTWACTSSPCPWGGQTGNQALVWSGEGNSDRLGYTVDRPVYLPAVQANGLTISLEFGVATLYAGTVGAASHRPLTTLFAGTSYRVDGLADGEVLSVQSGESFGYVLVPLDTTQPQPLSSRQVTWACSGGPCPWGSSTAAQAIVWPQSTTPSQQRLGYTTSDGIYLPATYANGMALEIFSGVAYVYAGLPNGDSHRLLAQLSPGEGAYQVGGVGAGEVLSVQSSDVFRFAVRSADPAAPGDPSAPVDPSQPQPSSRVVWSCVGSPCPWGATLSGLALTWPQSLAPVSDRLGYSTSTGIYLPAASANGVTISVPSGSATAYAVRSDDLSYRVLGTIDSGHPLTLSGLIAGELVSVQSSEVFAYQVAVREPVTLPPSQGVVHSVPARWRCNSPDCVGDDWMSAVISWPAWAAYEDNVRAGSQSRTVYSTSGVLLYPYMGAWADGCEVTAVSGNVLIVEWQRGADLWRETWLTPGQTHTISLVAPEDGAMIETHDGWAPTFSVQLSNCTPQVVR